MATAGLHQHLLSFSEVQCGSGSARRSGPGGGRVHVKQNVALFRLAGGDSGAPGPFQGHVTRSRSTEKVPLPGPEGRVTVSVSGRSKAAGVVL